MYCDYLVIFVLRYSFISSAAIKLMVAKRHTRAAKAGADQEVQGEREQEVQEKAAGRAPTTTTTT